MKSTVRSLWILPLATLLTVACGPQSTSTPPPTLAPTAAPTLAPTATASPAPTASPTPRPVVAYTPTPEPQIDTPAWFADTILYEIFVRSFYDSDANGIGDLKGVLEKLDYVQSLNAGAVWLLPIHPSPSYHGYDVTDYFAVNPDYGTLDDMVALVDAAHERGIRVIMDLVVNHTSDQHPFFLDAFGNPQSKYADWYLWTNDQHTAYQSFGGYKGMPKLNHQNPAVVDYVLQIARFWMDPNGDGNYADGVDGFRCDVAIEVPLTTWQALRQAMRKWNPDSFLLGEVWDMNARNLVKFYANAFDALFNFPLYSDLSGSNNVSQDSLLAGAQRPDMANLTLLAENKLLPPGFEIVQFVNNHDTNRVMSDVGGDWQRARTAATLLLTVPGTPMIYYGEEIGMKGEKGTGHPYWDEYRREPMDWYAAEAGPGMTTWFKPINRFNKPDDGISVEEESGVTGSLLEHYRALTALRLAHPALLRGAYAPVKVTGSQEVYAYTRHTPATAVTKEELFLVALNFSSDSQKVTLELDPAYVAPFTAADALSGDPWPDLPATAPYAVELPPASGLILQLSRF